MWKWRMLHINFLGTDINLANDFDIIYYIMRIMLVFFVTHQNTTGNQVGQAASATSTFLMNRRRWWSGQCLCWRQLALFVPHKARESTSRSRRTFHQWRFSDPFSTNWRAFGRQVENRKRTPSQRDRQQTGTAKGGVVIELPVQFNLIRLIYW